MSKLSSSFSDLSVFFIKLPVMLFMSKPFDIAVSRILKNEYGYSNTPNDPLFLQNFLGNSLGIAAR